MTIAEKPQAQHRSSARKSLTDLAIKALKPRDRAYKVADRDGLYVHVTPAGSKSFRYDYRIDGRRETLTIGTYGPDGLSLSEAREQLMTARKLVKEGVSPAKEKATAREARASADTFGQWAERYFAFKGDPKSGDETLADSTLALRRSVYRRILEAPLGKRRLDEIKPTMLAEICARAKEERGPGPAVHARELVLLVYRFAIGRGVETSNPADTVQRSAIATFKPRERNLDRREIKTFFDALQRTATSPTLRLAIKFMLLTMVRKGEFIGATWKEVDWDRGTWTIPKERMKADRAHTVYLSEQALDC
ncbi:MAG: integrase arm-type DNA-binding domain-containing protein [Hydrogenophaga sp.]|uniref:tyrosine-type recombinase/integrase n=1 Tax=Hydrogenophaga sp. TaxID=1904254 RepID=UPI00257969C9|nr:integrase arm-type DNA-binding domain-containing protein [Hydrogenophaga sp.]MBL0946474.1 integrase arm-type DNA-binding domain-containing protein [Hydrogenophaga sp.]